MKVLNINFEGYAGSESDLHCQKVLKNQDLELLSAGTLLCGIRDIQVEINEDKIDSVVKALQAEGFNDIEIYEEEGEE